MNPNFVLLYFTLSLSINPQHPVRLLVEFKHDRRPTGQLEQQESVRNSPAQSVVQLPAYASLFSVDLAVMETEYRPRS